MIVIFIINMTSISLENKNGTTSAQESKDQSMNQKAKK